MNTLHLLKVVHAEPLTPQIIQLLFKPEHPIAYASGQYIMLGFDAGDLKPFSIASAPRDDGLIECHIRNQADSEWMQKLFAVQTGDQLVMEGPKDQISLQPAHQPIIFMAGGTGFAPMKALLETLLKEKIGVPIHFYWGARSRSELYMHKEMIALTDIHPNLEYIPVLSENSEDWNGATGLVHQQVLKEHPNLTHITLYMCGPWPMIQAAKTMFLDAGLNAQACFH
ncbi:hypothetical protein MNBD_GAMMA03-1772 [hydrothermal vent metagenome]|uniref:FAD-binding FR-type domain-containing protein n=1 Tax=hydrothermal vent metagenome TaxID=652676 RepID=A0A3B0W1L1_9ZZZZ